MVSTEKRLIDANEALKKMQNWNTKERLINCVEDAPTVDAVEVVRCKDCEYFTKGMAVGMCKRIADKPIMPITYDHFCSYGERRNDGKSTSA